MKFVDLSGMKFGRLTVVEKVQDKNHRRIRWICKCECGSTKEICGENLRAGLTKSCGCLQKQVAAESSRKLLTKHGLYYDPLYKLWSHIMDRCTNKACKNYPRYGGQGITICDRWRDPESFINDIKQSIGDKPCSSMSIDRIENHKGYEPGNVRWATAKVQVQNRRCTLYLTIGQETKTLKEWSAFSGTNYNTMLTRLVRGGLSHREIVYGRGAK